MRRAAREVRLVTTIFYGARSSLVTEVQRALAEHEPGLRVDGHLGPATWAALQRAADRLRIDPLPAPAPGAVVWPDLIAGLLDPAADDDAPAPLVTPSCSGLVCEAVGGVRLYDLRGERVPERPAVRLDGPGRPHVRDPSRVVGIVLHQTAVAFGVSAAQLRAAGGDRALALAERALRIAAHATVFRAGPGHGPLISVAAPLLWHVNGANAINPLALNLEVDGLYEGVAGDRRTARGTASVWTEEIRDAARAALRWLVEHGRAEGMPLRYVWAHRQSSATRRSDPGELLWRDLAEWARSELGLDWQPARTWGDGRPLPRAWGGDAAY